LIMMLMTMIRVIVTWGVTIASLLGKPFNEKDTNVVYKCTLASSYNKIC
jgi:hypothetical protein